MTPTSAGRGITVLDGGVLTTVQDVPGRLGYWHVGVPPSGPMDDLSHRLVNRLLGNDTTAAALEITGTGPTLRFDRPATVAVGGATVPVIVDGIAARQWSAIDVGAGSTVTIGTVGGCGIRACFGVRGGIDVTPYLGSRSTFTLSGFGGYEGRALEAGDHVAIGDDIAGPVGALASGITPVITDSWTIGVLVGPHAEPEFIAPGGVDELLRTTWQVHFNSARTGVRLLGPKPAWARPDGGEAGLHPSNIHDTGYAFGTIDLTGDMPIVLGPDGPSLGGFVCPLTVASSERWKVGQLAPGDSVRFVAWTSSDAIRALQNRNVWLERCTERIEPVARPEWSNATTRSLVPDRTGVLDRVDTGDCTVTFRQGGDRFVLVEYGEMTLDLALRLRVQALDRWVQEHLRDGVVDATAGVRSLLVQLDLDSLSVTRAVEALRRAQEELRDVVDEPFPSRVVRLPLSWDDPATRDAIERYMRGVRSDAPWCPWNIEFIRRINGLESIDDVRRVVFDASYLVLGLGDVDLGAPVATPLDPRHRLVTTKYNPARTWTPENAVGIGGAYLCIYGMEGPGGYQFVGRTVQVWNRDRLGPHFSQPWLLRTFDCIEWFAVDSDELAEQRSAQARGQLALDIEETTFRPSDHRQFVDSHADEIDQFKRRQRAAFDAERDAWSGTGEIARSSG
jgi:urea carboxylase